MSAEDSELTFVRCPGCRSLVPAVATRCRMCGQLLESRQQEAADDSAERRSRVRQRTISVSGSEVETIKAEVTEQQERKGPEKKNPDNWFTPEPEDDYPIEAEDIEEDFREEEEETFPEPFEARDAHDFESEEEDEDGEDDDEEEAPVVLSPEEPRKKRKRRRKKKKKPMETAGGEPPQDAPRAGFRIGGDPAPRVREPERAPIHHEPVRHESVSREPERREPERRVEERALEQKVFDAPRETPRAPQPEIPAAPVRQEQKREEPVRTNGAGREQREFVEAPPVRHTVSAPLQSGEGTLVGWVVSFDTSGGTSREIREGRFFVGSQRLRPTDFVIEHPSVSTPQCLVAAAVDGMKVQDLMSEEGTYLRRSGEREYVRQTDPFVVESGDWIRFGECEMLVVLMPRQR